MIAECRISLRLKAVLQVTPKESAEMPDIDHSVACIEITDRATIIRQVPSWVLPTR